MRMLGRLLYGKIAGSGELWARHLDLETGVAHDQLTAPRVLHIDGGVLISGWDTHPGRGPTRQTWWCVPIMKDTVPPEPASAFPENSTP